MKSKVITFTIPLIIVFLCLVSSCRTEIEKGSSWDKRLTSIDKLNQFIIESGGKLIFKKKIIQKRRLDGIVAETFEIDNSRIAEVSAQYQKLKKLIIKDSEIKYVDFSQSIIFEMIIKDSRLDEFECKECQIDRFTILDSKLVENNFTILKGDQAIIQNSDIKSSYFFDSESKSFQILNTKFDQDRTSRFARLKSDLLFVKNSTLNNSFYESKIKKVVIENSKGSNAGFVRLEGETFLISDSKIGLVNIGPINKSFKSVVSRNSSFYRYLDFKGDYIEKITISGCPSKTGLGFTDLQIDKIEIENCSISSFSIGGTQFNSLHILNSKIEVPMQMDGWWFDSAFKNLELTNVVVDGPFKMENVRVDTLKTDNLKKGRNLKIIEKDVNFSLEPDSLPIY